MEWGLKTLVGYRELEMIRREYVTNIKKFKEVWGLFDLGYPIFWGNGL